MKDTPPESDKAPPSEEQPAEDPGRDQPAEDTPAEEKPKPGKPSFVVYIDESGDEGFSFSRGSSQWFVLSAAITRKEHDLETVRLVDTVRGILPPRPPKKPLHFRDLRHEHRVPYVAEIAKARLRIISVFIHKPSIAEPETFQQRYRLYFYGVRLLLERVSWLCRDHKATAKVGDGIGKLIFSNRAGMSYKELKDYLIRLREQTSAKDIRIEWDVIDPDQVYAYSAGRRMGLQIADAAASSSFCAVEPRYGFTEDRYIRELRPVVYRHRGRYLGYGLKFWPRETRHMLGTDERTAWLRSHFGLGATGPGPQDPTR